LEFFSYIVGFQRNKNATGFWPLASGSFLIRVIRIIIKAANSQQPAANSNKKTIFAPWNNY